MSAARDWLSFADPTLRDLLRRMTWHHKVKWGVPDYDVMTDDKGNPVDDGREIVDDLEQAEAVSSRIVRSQWTFDELPDDPESPAYHVLAIDLDVPAWLIPSSTEGHGHLYVDLPILEGDLWEFLDAAVKIGLVEEGYVSACKSRGMTSLRAPWIRKGEERAELGPDPVEVPS